MTAQNELFDLPVPEDPQGRACVKCGVKQPEENFDIANGGNYRRTECKSCIKKLAKTREALKKEHKYPTEEHVCPICERTAEETKRNNKNSFVLDHCHETDKFRGWICDHCNRGLGAFGDSVERLKKAIDYLSGTP